MLETLPLQQNLTDALTGTAAEAAKPIVAQLITILKPLIIALGGLIGLYIIYKIITAITGYLLKKRIKRMDKNIQELDKKVDEILKILKPKEKEKKKSK